MAIDSWREIAPIPHGVTVPSSSSECEDGPFTPGEVLDGKFRIERLIGRGAMGAVYLATDVYLRRRVAIKVLLDLYGDDAMQEFRREAEAMASVRHDNVVHIYSYGESQNLPFFAMEYIDGNSLADVCERLVAGDELMHLDEAIGLLAQACRGLHAIHQAGIVHRDVKPANILITKRYRVAVGDFGLVSPKVDPRSWERLSINGTPMYMAPERIRSQPIPDGLFHVCDIYALGVILFELLTNTPPFEGLGVMDLLQMHLTEPVPEATRLRPELPPAIDGVIARAMAKDPAARYATPMDFLEDLCRSRDRSYVVGGLDDEEHCFLIVDPVARSAAALLRMVRLAYPRATILGATDGTMALEIVREMQPQAVIFDAAAPGVTPHELCAALLADPELAEVKLIVIDGQASASERSYLRAMGAAEVLPKPAGRAAILTALRAEG